MANACSKKRDLTLYPNTPRSFSSRIAKQRPNALLWCLHCERVIRAGDLVRSEAGEEMGVEEACPNECGGCGFGVDIYGWDAMGLAGVKDPSTITAGQHVPLYTEEETAHFNSTEERARRATLIMKANSTRMKKAATLAKKAAAR